METSREHRIPPELELQVIVSEPYYVGVRNQNLVLSSAKAGSTLDISSAHIQKVF